MAVTPGDDHREMKLEGILGSAGERVMLTCRPRRLAGVLTGAVGGELTAPDDRFTMAIAIEDHDAPYSVAGFEQVARDAWRRGPETVFTNVSSSGFDLKLLLDGDRPSFTFRRRPPMRVRAAGLLAARSRQLTLLTLLAYPTMWWAVRNGRSPVHVSAFDAAGRVILVAGASGVGKSTVLRQELTAGARPISDNLCVTDGRLVWPVAEPMRVQGRGGARAPHGRSEVSIRDRAHEATPDAIVALRRGPASVRHLEPHAAARAVAAGTYTAGELRRFWTFAASLASATGAGPAHPPVAAAAEALANAAPCFEVSRPAPDGPSVSALIARRGAEAAEGVA
jgi:hypothetical protein